MNHLMPKDDQLFHRIDDVVHYIWDPIGICDHPEARDEYSGYLSEIYARVKMGDEEGLLEYMKWVVVDHMGMIFDREKAVHAAHVMVRWKQVIDRPR